MVELHLDGVTTRYGDVVALEDVDLDVREGEFFTLLGPSGCGKTTTLRTVAGFETPDAGRVRFDDRDVTALSPEARDVGLVFQHYALFPHLSVAENVAYGLRFRDPPGGVTTDERVAELLELVDLEGFGGREPDALSGGQQQRVALARALAPGPEVLLLDEPMSALDARLREELRLQVKAIQSALSITTLYVTHDQEEALAISDRLAVMHGGRIEQVGTPREVYREPASRFVAGFVGENNRFDGTVVERDGSVGDGSVGAAGASGPRADIAVRVEDETFRVWAPHVEAATGESVTLCVRPEDLHPEVETNRLDLAVEQVEYLGTAVRVHARWKDQSVVVRLDDAPDGEVLSVGFDPADAHLVRE